MRADPERAQIRVDGRVEVISGQWVRLDRNQPHFVDVRLDGYRAQRILIGQEFNAEFLANFLLMPFFGIGMLTDAITGAINNLEPREIQVHLITCSEG